MADSNYFNGGVAVITGGASGLGASMARRFFSQGMRVAILDINGEKAEETASGMSSDGTKAIGIQVDVANVEAIQLAAQTVEEKFGECSVLCANVGVQQFGAIDKLTLNDWQWIINVNVMGVVHTINTFLPLVRKSKKPRHVVITASSAAYSPGVRMGAYTSSKYAITGYGETLRMELADEEIGVSLLFPAGMSTTHIESSIKARPSDLGASVVRREDIDAMKASRNTDCEGQVVTADYATRYLLRELTENRRYIITHGNDETAITSHYNDLLEAHKRAQKTH